MAWCRPGDKLLSEPMMVNLLTYMCHLASMSYLCIHMTTEVLPIAPGLCGCNGQSVIFKLISRLDILRIHYKLALHKTSLTLVQVVAWFHQAFIEPNLCCHMASLVHIELIRMILCCHFVSWTWWPAIKSMLVNCGNFINKNTNKSYTFQQWGCHNDFFFFSDIILPLSIQSSNPREAMWFY